jgi:hypothetical protein
VEIAVAAIQEFRAMTCLQKEFFRRSEFKEIITIALATSDIIVDKISVADAKINGILRNRNMGIFSTTHSRLFMEIQTII